MFHHMRARTRGHHDVARRFLEHFDCVLCDRACLCVKTRTEERLAATSLVAGEVHAQAEAAENAHDRLASLRVERIDKACYKKLDAIHAVIVMQTARLRRIRKSL